MERTCPTPLVFGRAGRHLFGFFHAPSGERRRALGVVLCNPLGYDAMCTHRTYRHLADRLAARGFPVLRFDYHGTGDSSGGAEEPERVHAWRESIDEAIAEVRARGGVSRVALYGVRFGATLAAAAAAEHGDVEALILWAPPSGRAYTRELRAFRLIKEEERATPRAPGDEDVAGYFFDPTTLSQMAAIDPMSMTCRARNVLILGRELPAGEARLAKHLESHGANVSIGPGIGYAQMMRDPQDTVVPHATLEEIEAWLSGIAGSEGAASPTAAPPASRLDARAPSGGAVQEALVTFGEEGRLFGILTEPTERDVVRGSPAVLFLNVGANHRVGPNRMYVSMARDLAALGYRCFRFDLAGLGDSRMAPGAQENRLYSKDSVGDVKAAMDFLQKLRDVSRFVLVGLCSGAYLAFHTSIEERRVAGQVLLNPQTFEWKEGDSLELSIRKSRKSTRFYVRAAFDPKTWTRVLRGEVNVRGVAETLIERAGAQAASRARAAVARMMGEVEPQTEIERAFVAISDRGIESLLVFSFNDGGLDMIEKHLGSGARKMGTRKNFQFRIVDGADHTFTPIPSQRALHGIITRYVTGSFG